jgi:uncharacterized membrane protein
VTLWCFLYLVELLYPKLSCGGFINWDFMSTKLWTVILAVYVVMVFYLHIKYTLVCIRKVFCMSFSALVEAAGLL